MCNFLKASLLCKFVINLMALNGFLFSLTKFLSKAYIYRPYIYIQKYIYIYIYIYIQFYIYNLKVSELNEKLGRRKFEWIHNFDSLHTWVMTDLICSAIRPMISWWVKIFLLLFINFKTNDAMSIIPPCSLLFSLHLEWSLNRSIDNNQM